MRQTQVQPPVVTLGLILTLCCLPVVLAQSGCVGDAHKHISFNELDPPAVPQLNDSAYHRAVMITDPELYSVTIRNDPDRPNAYPFDEYFVLTYVPFFETPGYYIFMKKGIDRDGTQPTVDDDVDTLQYVLECRESNDSPAIQFYAVIITILDKNDNAPVFVNAPYEVDVNELTPTGLTIFHGISAYDLDKGPDQGPDVRVTYSVSDSATSEFQGSQDFYLPNPEEGFLAVQRMLDFESMYRQTGFHTDLMYYNLTITATDLGVPALTSTTSMIIYLRDGDDLDPEFVYSTCIPSSEPFGEACIAPHYKTSVTKSATNMQSLLVFTPDPADPSNASATVDIIMQDRDTLNDSVACAIARTRPAGYEAYFNASTSFVSGKQYKCSVVRNAGMPAFPNGIQELEILIEAVEDSANHRTEAATISVEITGESQEVTDQCNSQNSIVISSANTLVYLTGLWVCLRYVAGC